MDKLSISPEQKQLITRAVLDAERFTSIEILVHIDNFCKEDVDVKASSILRILQSNKQVKKNWILFYVSLEDKKYTVVCDDDLKGQLSYYFWADVKMLMKNKIVKGDLTASLIEGITLAGSKLKWVVPKKKDDTNEVPDDVIIFNC